MPTLAIDPQEDGPPPVFLLGGTLDVATRIRLHEVLEPGLRAAWDDLVLDLTWLSYLDSHGVAALMELARAARGRIVLRNATALPRFVLGSSPELRSVLGLTAADPFVLMVGTIEARKNHRLAYRAWRDLLTRHRPGDVPRLVFVGRPGWLIEGLLEEMKKDQRLAQVPVIVVTSLEKREDQERGLALGTDAYVVKRKFDHQDLLESIRQIL